ncbi:MAG: nickel pincer cofactor biosynthesis protein LarC, partial [Planctomycetaceae bacterium]
MRVAYLDCATGISGDMTLGALLDAGVDRQALLEAIDALNLTGVTLEIRSVVKGGFRATKVNVRHPEQHAHRHLSDIQQILEEAGPALKTSQKDLALQIFQAVAEAEARVHGMSVDTVHFHEVGAIDSIVDIVGAAVGFDLLGADTILCSRVPTGRGQVKIDHGVCQVPTPGTAELLKGAPLVDVPIDAELTTPTGAAILKVLVDAYVPLPEMTIETIGYGAGTKDFRDRANVLRLIVGETIETPQRDIVMLLETNLDTVSGEVLGHTKRQLMSAGALDVYSTAIQMKKDRPGVMLSVLCRPESADSLENILFSETGTLGVRRSQMERAKQSRAACTVHTEWGPVEGKIAWRPGQPL